MVKWGVLLLPSLCIIVCACTPRYVTVTGQVVDGKTAQPVPSAIVCLSRDFNDGLLVLLRDGYQHEKSESKTDSSGNFVLEKVIQYSRIHQGINTTLAVSKEGYVPLIRQMHTDPIDQYYAIMLVPQITGIILPQGYADLNTSLRKNLDDEEFYFSFKEQRFVNTEKDADIALVFKTFNRGEYPQSYLFDSMAIYPARDANESRVLWEIRSAGKGRIAVVPMEQYNAFEILTDCDALDYGNSVHLVKNSKQNRSTLFCAMTRDGKTYAKLSWNPSGGFDWVFQPDGTSNVGTAIIDRRLQSLEMCY